MGTATGASLMMPRPTLLVLLVVLGCLTSLVQGGATSSSAGVANTDRSNCSKNGPQNNCTYISAEAALLWSGIVLALFLVIFLLLTSGMLQPIVDIIDLRYDLSMTSGADDFGACLRDDPFPTA